MVGELRTLQSLNAQQKAMISLIEANFTQHMQYLNQERDIVIRERDKYNHEAIVLRRDNTMLQEQLAAYTRYCPFVCLSACQPVCPSVRPLSEQLEALWPSRVHIHFLFPPYLSRKCKEDFAHSLDGINTVTRDFLGRINTMFPHQLTFHLTCDSQRDYMEKMRNSCTNLSRDVENKFQHYLNRVGDKVGAAVTHRGG